MLHKALSTPRNLQGVFPAQSIPIPQLRWMLFLCATVLDTPKGNRRRLTREAKLCVCGHRQRCFFIFVAQNITRTNFFPFSPKRHRGDGFLVLKQEISISNTNIKQVSCLWLSSILSMDL